MDRARRDEPEAKAAAVFIGPTVCDDDGPIPTLNSSKTLIIAALRAPLQDGGARPDRRAERSRTRTGASGKGPGTQPACELLATRRKNNQTNT